MHRCLTLLLLVCLLGLPPAAPVLAAMASPSQQPYAASPVATSSLYDWLQFGFDQQHSGNNTLETIITPANVSQLKLLFQTSLPASPDGTPVYLNSVSTATGPRDVLFITTTAGHTIALDALTGATVWTRWYPAGPCRINNGTDICYTISSPALDPNRQYVYSYGLDGYVHKFQVGNGKEIKTGGFPEVSTLKPFNEKGTADLSFATAMDGNTYLYMASSGYPTDAGDYEGHVTTINLANGSQRVFNTMCSKRAAHYVIMPVQPGCPYDQGAVWGRPGVVYSRDTDRIYLTSSNGIFDPSRNLWADTVMALHPDGTGANGWPLDSFTPVNYQALQDTDQDLGSTSPAILPAPATSKVQHLAVQGGKDGRLRLLNLDDLSSKGGPGHVGGAVGRNIPVPQGGEVRTQPTVWVNPSDSTTWVFVATDEGFSALQLNVDSNGMPSLVPKWTLPQGGSSPIVVNNVLFYVGPLYTAPGHVSALDPVTGQTLWSATTRRIHANSPIVANGVLYVNDLHGTVFAYSLNGAVPARK